MGATVHLCVFTHARAHTRVVGCVRVCVCSWGACYLNYRTALLEKPDIVVGTPCRILAHCLSQVCAMCVNVIDWMCVWPMLSLHLLYI